jgi:hypothetical protein
LIPLLEVAGRAVWYLPGSVPACFLLVAHADDDAYENRVIGAIALQDLRFEFAFCDTYVHGRSRFGPGAAEAVRANLAAALRAWARGWGDAGHHIRCRRAGRDARLTAG